MHQILFRGEGFAPDPTATGGAYSAPPDALAGFKGPTTKGKEGKRRGMDGKETEGREWAGKGREEGGW